MRFNVDVAPTRTHAGISLICEYLINCKICDVTLDRGDLRNVTTSGKDGGGVKKSLNSCDVIYGWPLISLMSPSLFYSDWHYLFRNYEILKYGS